jgi:multidrug efflux system membrane fusion protein
MDDRTTTGFTRARPLDRPVPAQAPAQAPARPRKRRGFGLILLLLIAGAGAGWWFYSHQPAGPEPAARRGNGGGQAMPVVAVPAVAGDIDIALDALGTVTSLATVTIRTQISGQFIRVAYQEGQMVQKGDLMAEIDSRPYELALTQAQGALARDQAMLQAAELDLKRYQDLAKTNAIPRQQLDQQQALVLQDRGNVLTDQAQIDTQKLNITYCHIVAPVTGRVGLRLVDQGNYVTPGDASGIAVITQLQPISVIFTVAEDNLPQIMKRLRANATLAVTAFDRSDTTKLADGEVRTLDNQIDTTTGTVKLRAEFANADESLFPNQFVNIKLHVDVLRNATIMPTSAVQRGAPGTFVYLLGEDNTVSVRPITLGPISGERVAVQSGLAPGDRVVVDGADRLRNGARVTLREPSGSEAGAAAPPRARGGGRQGGGERRGGGEAAGTAGDAAAAQETQAGGGERRGGGRRNAGEAAGTAGDAAAPATKEGGPQGSQTAP